MPGADRSLERRRRPPSPRRCRTRLALGRVGIRRRRSWRSRTMPSGQDSRPASWDLHAERGQKIRSRLRELYAVLDARQSRRQHVAVAIDRLRGGDDALAQLGAPLGIDSLAQRDDALVERKNAVESRDGRERLLNASVERLRKCRFVGGADLALDLEDFAIAIRRPPIPRRPLDLYAGQPIRIERRAQWVEARTPIPDAPERRDARFF